MESLMNKKEREEINERIEQSIQEFITTADEMCSVVEFESLDGLSSEYRKARKKVLDALADALYNIKVDEYGPYC